MTKGIPTYGLKAYALLFTRHGARGRFRQSELDWMVSTSMRKKIFSLLLRSGWIRKHPDGAYSCVAPEAAIKGLLVFRVPGIMRAAKRDYAFTGLSAVEIWSDFSYVQRGMEKSPYFIKVLRKDLGYWKRLFNGNEIPYYIGSGTTIGEYAVLVPVRRLAFVEKDGLKVEPLRATMRYARSNGIYAYASGYMERRYGAVA